MNEVVVFTEAAMAFARVLYPLAYKYRGSCISWFRSDEHNEELPGHVDNSLHRCGCAMDVQFLTVREKNDFAAECQQLGLEVVVKNTVVHVEMDLKSWLDKNRSTPSVTHT